jgi:hypothetical protein
MKINKSQLAMVAFVLLLVPAFASAGVWELGDWSAYIDGSTFNPPGLPTTVNSSGFDFTTGLGSLVFNFSTAGTHNVGVYLYPFYNGGFGDTSGAFGSVNGSVPLDITYQLGWPGVPDGGGFTVFDYFAANSLNGSNTVGTYVAPPTACCSVVLAEIFSFTNKTGNVTFTTSTTAPTGGFYLQVTDHDSTNSYYLTQTSALTPISSSVPEPGTLLLLGIGIGAVCIAYRKPTNKNS